MLTASFFGWLPLEVALFAAVFAFDADAVLGVTVNLLFRRLRGFDDEPSVAGESSAAVVEITDGGFIVVFVLFFGAPHPSSSVREDTELLTLVFSSFSTLSSKENSWLRVANFVVVLVRGAGLNII